MQKLCAMDDVEGWNSGNLHPLICQLWTWHDFSSIYYIATYSRYTTYLYLSIHQLFVYRCFGPKCGGCGEKIHYQDFVRKARDKVYHLRCFTCSLCSKQLSTGEVLYLQPGDEGFVCKDHYLKQGKLKL